MSRATDKLYDAISAIEEAKKGLADTVRAFPLATSDSKMALQHLRTLEDVVQDLFDVIEADERGAQATLDLQDRTG